VIVVYGVELAAHLFLAAYPAVINGRIGAFRHRLFLSCLSGSDLEEKFSYVLIIKEKKQGVRRIPFFT